MSASDWMKMRTNLWDDPRVGAIADEAGTGEAAVIGALYWLWATADEHSTDGLLAGMTLRQVDRKTGVPGFAAAMAKIGWVTEIADGLQIVRFDEHNGQSAKTRALTARRVAKHKTVTAENETGNAEGVTPPLAQRDLEEEEEREVKAEKQDQERVARSPSGSRLPADWQPDADDLRYASEQGVDGRHEAEKFRDYWHSVAGAKGRKADWAATWRNWIRRAAEDRRNATSRSSSHAANRQSTSATERVLGNVRRAQRNDGDEFGVLG